MGAFDAAMQFHTVVQTCWATACVDCRVPRNGPHSALQANESLRQAQEAGRQQPAAVHAGRRGGMAGKEATGWRANNFAWIGDDVGFNNFEPPQPSLDLNIGKKLQLGHFFTCLAAQLCMLPTSWPALTLAACCPSHLASTLPFLSWQLGWTWAVMAALTTHRLTPRSTA